MPKAADIQWFKEQFQPAIVQATQGTPFDVDMVTSIACQETGYIWQVLRTKPLSTAQICALCVGDTLDADRGRSAFPKTKDALIAAPRGQDMFDIAHKALVDMAQFVPGYSGAAANARKFCHGYGIFQYDLQFFKTDPDYFLERRYEKFEESLKKCLEELTAAAKRIGFANKTSLTDLEFAAVAIAYNTGGYKPERGLKQGFFNGTKFYGEEIFDFLRVARTVAVAGAAPVIAPPDPGHAPVANPTPVAATGKAYVVDTQTTTLRLRSAPKIDPANIVGELPDGHPVRAVTGVAVKGFLEVETSLNGANLHGFASEKFLKAAPPATPIPVLEPAPALPTSGIVAVYMPRKAGTITKRSDIAGAHSLNEPNQPTRKGTTPDELRAELAAIIAWLAVDRPTHKRYQPRPGVTFCNIYAHDYCTLAGVYLPRVWWSGKALEKLAQGQQVQPLYGDTIDEVRANDLFRWLRDFGQRFGWRRTGTLTRLQTEVDEGAIGLIVARRKEDGRSGHIVVVVPETTDDRAKRDAAGEVIAPLQSQAGVTNFRYGTSRLNWWLGQEFAESAFWIHS